MAPGGPTAECLACPTTAIAGAAADEATEVKASAGVAATEDPVVDVAGAVGAIVGALVAWVGRSRHCRVILSFSSGTQVVNGRRRTVVGGTRANVKDRGVSVRVF